ncbi:hypothetical protein GmHk_10G028887 [Glycine max]|nr:hypothetical protein GmHk_10G028887 [Glycine max]
MKKRDTGHQSVSVYGSKGSFQWPDTTQFVLDRDFSDHCPILLRSKSVDWGPKPFKVMDWWLQDKGFQEISNFHPSRWGGYALKQKLKFIKACIRQWSSSNGVINAKKIQVLKKELNALEAGISDRILNQSEVELKKSLQEQLWHAANAYECMLRQMARVKWLKEGDRNSAYFHKLINHRRRHNVIQGLIIDGEWVQDPSRVKTEAFNHFKDRFSEQNFNRPTLDGVQLPSLGQSENEALVARFSDADTVCLPKARGGLGIKDLNNLARQLANNPHQLWARTLVSIYGGWHALLHGRGSVDNSPWWKDLKSIFQQQHQSRLATNLRWKVGNGARIQFWKDKWRKDDITLKDKYPVSQQQDLTISLMGQNVDNGWDWKFQWRRIFFDHEIDMVEAFMDAIDGVQIHSSRMDHLTWRAEPSGSYSTKSAYIFLMEDGSSEYEDNASRLPTKANLRRRQVCLPSYSCPLCDGEEETIGHVMFDCTRTRCLWWEALRWADRVGPFTNDPKDHFIQFSSWSSKRCTDNRWAVLWIALSMTIWKHRNLMGRGVKWAAVRRLIVSTKCILSASKKPRGRTLIKVFARPFRETPLVIGILFHLWKLLVAFYKLIFVNVYAPCDLVGKKALWDELRQLKASNPSGMWCFLGDFNSIRSSQERISLSQRRADPYDIAAFNQWIDDMELQEIKCSGNSFTWIRPNGCVKSRLDRFLVSQNWLSLWPESYQTVLQRNLSDHCPSILQTNMVDWGPKPFRVFDWWLQQKGYQKMVREAWKKDQQGGWGGIALKNKLKNLKSVIKKWSKAEGNINPKKVLNIQQKLNEVEDVAAHRNLTNQEIKDKTLLQQELWNASNAFESLLRQKSRARWLKEGDYNTAYFHKYMNFRRAHNNIPALMGRWIWAFASGQQQLWVRVLISKYGGWPEFQHDTDKRGFSHWWRDLRKIFHQSDHNIFKHQLTWKVGCGETIKFWTDKWLGEDYTLEQKYNQLFLISRQQNSLISNMGEFNHDSWEWNLRWRRNLFDHESDLAVQFMEEIYFVPIQRHIKDSMLWLAEPHGQYTTKSAYRLCINPSTSSVITTAVEFKLNLDKYLMKRPATLSQLTMYCLGFRRNERKINESQRTTSVFTLH